MKKETLWISIGIVVALLAIPLLARLKANSLPRLGRVADFSLTDRSGKTVTSDQLKGHVWITNTMFTNCPAECPVMTESMSRLQGQLPEDIYFVSVTVDPGRDSLLALSQYAKEYDADPSRWFFLTGNTSMINTFARSLHMPKISNPYAHSLKFVLIDKEMNVRGYYQYLEISSIRKLVKDARHLAQK